MRGRPLVVTGGCALEHVFQVQRFSATAGSATAQDCLTRPGGRAAQAAWAVQALRRPRASPPVRLVTAVGDDEAAEWTVHALERERMATGGVQLVHGARTAVTAVLVDVDGQRQVHAMTGDALARATLPDAALWQDATAVLADPLWPAAAQAALAAARQAGVPAMLQAEAADTALLQSLVPLADWIVFSREGLRAWAGTRQFIWQTQAKQVARQWPDRHIVVALGADGLWWQAPGQPALLLPALPRAAEDRDAARAVLNGALLLGLGEGRRPEFALRWALAASSLADRREDLQRATVNRLMEPAAGSA